MSISADPVKFVHPMDTLRSLASEWNIDVSSDRFAAEMDQRNIYPCNRDKFCYPKLKDLPSSKIDLSLVDNPESECIYMCGNSLGLQPKSARTNVETEFDKWAKIGVFGHLEGDLPWATCEDMLRPQMGRIVGNQTSFS